jgi:two-component system, response regulator PdtaR
VGTGNVVPLTAAVPLPASHIVLVVEDDVLIRLMIADQLRERGFAVVEASNADEAITLLQSQVPVNLVLTDVRMPGSMDGIALAKLVRETRPELKLVITSGNSTGDTSAADAFFRKPYDLDRLIDRIEELLAPGTA